MVKQPMILQSHKILESNQQQAENRFTIKKNKSYGARRYTTEINEKKGFGIKNGIFIQTQKTAQQAQLSPFRAGGNQIMLETPSIATTQKSRDKQVTTPAQREHKLSHNSQYDIDSVNNLSQANEMSVHNTGTFQSMGPVLSEPHNKNNPNVSKFVSVQHLMNLNNSQGFNSQDSKEGTFQFTDYIQPFNNQRVIVNSRSVQKRGQNFGNQNNISNQSSNKNVQIIVSNSGTVTAPNPERIFDSKTIDLSAQKSIRYRDHNYRSSNNIIKLSEIDDNGVSKAKPGQQSNVLFGQSKKSKSFVKNINKNELKSLLSLKEYQEQKDNKSLEIKNIDLLNGCKMGVTEYTKTPKKQKGINYEKAQRMAHTDQSYRSELNDMDNKGNIEILYDQLNDNMTHIDTYEIQGAMNKQMGLGSEPGFIYGQDYARKGSSAFDVGGKVHYKTMKKDMSKKTFHKFFNKRQKPGAFNYFQKGKNSVEYRGKSDNSQSSNQGISRIFSATDMNSAERGGNDTNTRIGDTQSLSTQIKTHTSNTVMQSKRKGVASNDQQYFLQQQYLDNMSNDGTGLDANNNSNPYNNASNRELQTEMAPKNYNNSLLKNDNITVVNQNRQIPQKDKQQFIDPIQNMRIQQNSEPPIQLHIPNVDIGQDLKNAKKFRKVHQAKLEYDLLNNALNDEKGTNKKKLDMTDIDEYIKQNQQDQNILTGEIVPFSGQNSTRVNQNQEQAQDVYGSVKKIDKNVKKRINLYERRDQEFKKVYQQKISQLRQAHAKENRSLSNGEESSMTPFMSMGISVQPSVQTPDKTPDQSRIDDSKSNFSKKVKIQPEVKFKSSVLRGDKKKTSFNPSDLNIYQQQNDSFNITSNRIRVLRSKNLDRKFRHRDQHIYLNGLYKFNTNKSQEKVEKSKQDKIVVDKDQDPDKETVSDPNQVISLTNVSIDPFDPIRMRLRVMPLSRAPNLQGKSPDFYFIQASKQSLQNNLTLAVESLYRGLAINPQHMLCRFTHGVLMFKLGLLTQARDDFLMILPIYPKEYFISYNYALTLLQLGDYDQALDVLNSQLSRSKEASMKSKDSSHSFDNLLYYDSLILKAQCLWRSNQALEAVKAFNTALRHKPQSKSKREKRKYTEQELEAKLQDMISLQTKFDLMLEYGMQRAERSISPQFGSGKNDYFIRIQKNSNIISPNDQMNQANQEIHIISQNEEELDGMPESKGTSQTENMVISQNVKHEPSIIELTSSKESSTKKIYRDQETKSIDQVEGIQIFGQTFSDKSSTLQKESQRLRILSGPSQQTQNASQTMYISKASVQNALSSQQSLIHQVNNKQLSKKKIMETTLLTPQPEQMDEQQIRIVDEEVNNILKGERNITNQSQSYQNTQQDTQAQEAYGVTNNRESKDRLNVQRQSNNSRDFAQSRNSRKSDFISGASRWSQKTEQAPQTQIEDRTIKGTNFAQNGMGQINFDQGDLEQMIVDLDKKFVEVSSQVQTEIDKQDKKIYNVNLKDEDVSDYIIRNRQKNGDEASAVMRQDKVIEKLKECMTRPTPDDIQNVLLADLKEKQEIRLLQDQTLSDKAQRLDQRKLMMIKSEFESHVGSKRSVKNLDLMLSHLKFFSRFTKDQRKMVFQEAEFLSLPARTTIFKQGDIGDRMYVILKGRVAVEKTTEEQGNLPVVQALLNDGDHFGELGLIDQDKINKHTKEGGLMLNDYLKEHGRFHTRKASCITAEHTDLLMVQPKLSNLLFQPDKQKRESPKHVEEYKKAVGVNPNVDMEEINHGKKGHSCSSVSGDELSKKISMLQSLEVFSDLDPSYLMPIAANIVPKTYNYGEFLVEKGNDPPGLFVISEGQCKVVAKRVGTRKLIDNRAGGPPGIGVKDTRRLELNDPILQDYNPSTSILNQVNSMKRGYQNARVLIGDVDKEGFGHQIKDKMEYIDYMVFNQLTKGNSWGSRVLVPFDLYLKRKRLLYGDRILERFYPPGTPQVQKDKEKDENYHMKSLLSVVADSAKVHVWIIRKQDMSYLPDKALQQVCEKIIAVKEEDRPHHEQDILYIIEQFQKWDKFKIDQVDQLLERKAMDKFFKGK